MPRLKWPPLPDTSNYKLVDVVNLHRGHCKAMASHARDHPRLVLQASEVGAFAEKVEKTMTELLEACYTGWESGLEAFGACDEMGKYITNYLNLDWPPQNDTGSNKVPATATSTPDRDPLNHPNNENQIRIHWEKDKVAPPYRGIQDASIIHEVQHAVLQAQRYVRICSAQVLPSGDLEIHTSSRKDTDALVAYSNEWISHLRLGRYARILRKSWSILVHDVPADWFTSQALSSGMAARQIMLQNPQVPNAYVSYVDWLTGNTLPLPLKSSLIVSFDRPEHASAFLQEGTLYLNCIPLRTQKFDEHYRLFQCPNCQMFGHSRRNCNSSRRCPYCGDSHKPVKCRNTANLFCANCQGPHASQDTSCRALRLAHDRIKFLQKHMASPYPKPAVKPATVPSAGEQATPKPNERILPPDSNVPINANCNISTERPRKRKKCNCGKAANADLPVSTSLPVDSKKPPVTPPQQTAGIQATLRSPLGTLNQQTMNKPQALDPTKYPPGSEYPFEDDYPSEPEHSETESEPCIYNWDPAQQSSASDAEPAAEPSPRTPRQQEQTN
ncbi:gag-like protein [Aspergillus tubingensis]|uniref:gag-like protein n=1 Tax=Aspergillus tubingensis TaxID=5068 RepID=UPI001578C179|nr:gag-like protein [Aspergillus tubingensis]GFN21522.1 gag-like protein [Aspergillus tubingensis]